MGELKFESINEPGQSRQTFSPPSINEPPELVDRLRVLAARYLRAVQSAL